jgi:hypothetical protein
MMSLGLLEFDTRNHHNRGINFDHYRALAWEGLNKTKAYNSLTDEERAKIGKDLDFIVSHHSLLNCD